ncbi:uncharacterized protein LOC100827054 [Brachypodium distachyon]|uniref:Uncharacterized protein n=1 Tax=Brachypodium distachyon TaxID=15368 RepID=I1HJ69_BRADI|nr:uncharacterized protein LOC100827054 [Brachypodium distachyon]KQK06130.1 hypothetical protein BRADI_2g24720v3 [Brachypodium distachyon]|eukprot:XP_003566216.1 uncharacterized protein LOC100827054 [Brachypodium distachyon]
MNGYSNLASSSPPATAAASAGGGGRARRSLELTNTKETNAWEGLAIGAVTLARTFSTGSHRLCRSGEKVRAAGHLPGALRRAFSMRRHPAAPGKGDGYYWRIHDMDGGSDGEGNACEERDEKEEDEEEQGKKKEEEGDVKEEAKGMTKKKRGIFKACKKLFWL